MSWTTGDDMEIGSAIIDAPRVVGVEPNGTIRITGRAKKPLATPFLPKPYDIEWGDWTGVALVELEQMLSGPDFVTVSFKLLPLPS